MTGQLAGQFGTVATLSVAGRTAPAPSPVSLLSRSASGRPPELDDADWLRRRLASDGTPAIAQELGVSRGSVIRACERLGVASANVGRRRGRSLQAVPADGQSKPSGEVVLTGTALQMLNRFHEDQRLFGGAPPSEDLLASRIRQAVEARTTGDQLAYEDALLAIASAAGLIHQHQQRLRSGHGA